MKHPKEIELKKTLGKVLVKVTSLRILLTLLVVCSVTLFRLNLNVSVKKTDNLLFVHYKYLCVHSYTCVLTSVAKLYWSLYLCLCRSGTDYLHVCSEPLPSHLSCTTCYLVTVTLLVTLLPLI